MEEFEKELTNLINRHSLENEYGNVPDFILARYIMKSLDTLKETINDLESWHGN
jgi:hypothetical protein